MSGGCRLPLGSPWGHGQRAAALGLPHACRTVLRCGGSPPLRLPDPPTHPHARRPPQAVESALLDRTFDIRANLTTAVALTGVICYWRGAQGRACGRAGAGRRSTAARDRVLSAACVPPHPPCCVLLRRLVEYS